MARFRISAAARKDLHDILATSLQRWGDQGRERYAALLAAAWRAIARAPAGSGTRDRGDLESGIRSLPIKHVRADEPVRDPVHVIFYRAAGSTIAIARVLHERMEPRLHVATPKLGTKRRPRK